MFVLSFPIAFETNQKVIEIAFYIVQTWFILPTECYVALQGKYIPLTESMQPDLAQLSQSMLIVIDVIYHFNKQFMCHQYKCLSSSPTHTKNAVLQFSFKTRCKLALTEL